MFLFPVGHKNMKNICHIYENLVCHILEIGTLFIYVTCMKKVCKLHICNFHTFFIYFFFLISFNTFLIFYFPIFKYINKQKWLLYKISIIFIITFCFKINVITKYILQKFNKEKRKTKIFDKEKIILFLSLFDT